MPCRSYDDDYSYNSTLREKNDRLARIACRAIAAIEAGGSTYSHLYAMIMKDKETAEWWPKHKEADRKDKQKREAESVKRKEQAAAKELVLAKLSEEEKLAFGLVQPSRRNK